MTKKSDASAPRSALRAFFLFNAILLALLAAFFVYLYLLRVVGLPFSCHVHDRLHLYCPGCGCTRAAEELLRLRLISSLLSNPAVLGGGAVILYYEIALLLSARRGTRVSPLPAILFAVALIAFFVIRNLLLVCFRIDYLNDLVVFWS